MKHASIAAGRSWQDSRRWGSCLVALYVMIALLPLTMALSLRPETDASPVHRLGAGAALVAFPLLILQFVLSGRLRFVERPFGLDAVMRFHKAMGLLALVLLIAHPALLSLDRGNLWLVGLRTPWPVNLGKAALSLLAVLVAGALLVKKGLLDYQKWRVGHKGVIIVLGLAFVHSSYVGPDLQATALCALWPVLFGGAALLFTYRNLFVPLWGRKRLRVVGVTRETHDTYTVSFESAGGGGLPHAPGQFWFLKLVRPGRSSEEHPFTISSAPTGEPPLTCTIKKSGDFTGTIDATVVGDGALVEGPFGRFSLVNDKASGFFFVAAGVGITPIMSMLRFLRDTGDARPAVLIYFAKTERDIIFRDEIDRMPENMKRVYVLSRRAGDWHGPTGHITAALIRAHAGLLLESADAYVCGPPAMIEATVRALRSLDVKGGRVHFERFAL